MRRFQEGLVCKAHRLLYASILGLRVIKRKNLNRGPRLHWSAPAGEAPVVPHTSTQVTPCRCRARREHLKVFRGPSAHKWLKARPESGLDWRMRSKFVRRRTSRPLAKHLSCPVSLVTERGREGEREREEGREGERGMEGGRGGERERQRGR